MEVLGKQPFQYLESCFGSVGTLEFLQELVDGLPDLLQVLLHRCLAFDPIGVVPGAVAGVRRKFIRQPHLVRFAQDALDALQTFYQ